MKLEDYIANVEKRVEAQEENKGEWIVGIVEETAEVIKASTLEEHLVEVGDLFFYCTAWIKSIGGDNLYVFNEVLEGYTKTLVAQSSWTPPMSDIKGQNMLLDVADSLGYWKKVVFHAHEVDLRRIQIEVMSVIQNALLFITACHPDEDFYLEDIFDKHIEKKDKRYPKGFSKEASQNRDAALKPTARELWVEAKGVGEGGIPFTLEDLQKAMKKHPNVPRGTFLLEAAVDFAKTRRKTFTDTSDRTKGPPPRSWPEERRRGWGS